MKNLNGRLTKAEAVMACLADEEKQAEANAAGWQQRFDELVDDANAILRATPPELQEAVYDRLSAALDAFAEGGWSASMDGLLSWAHKAWPHNKTFGLPIPDGIPAAVIQCYLDDPQAQPWSQCRECGLPLPCGPQGDRECFFEKCPACGGAHSCDAFRHHLHKVAQRFVPRWHEPGTDYLAAIRDLGYRVGERLGDWATGRTERPRGDDA